MGLFHRWRRGPESNRPTRICNRWANTAHRERTPGRKLRAPRFDGAGRSAVVEKSPTSSLATIEP